MSAWPRGSLTRRSADVVEVLGAKRRRSRIVEPWIGGIPPTMIRNGSPPVW